MNVWSGVRLVRGGDAGCIVLVLVCVCVLRGGYIYRKGAILALGR